MPSGLPSLPSLPGDTDEKTVEEIRRTIVVMGIGASSSAQDVMDYFATGAGEVKYFRWCSKEGADEGSRFALVEFSDYGAVPAAMRLNNTMLGDFTVKVRHVATFYNISHSHFYPGLLQQSGHHKTSSQE